MERNKSSWICTDGSPGPFKGTVNDKSKPPVPYVQHPRAVAAKVVGAKEKVVALLHDVLEDLPEDIYNEDMMRDQFGDEITNTAIKRIH